MVLALATVVVSQAAGHIYNHCHSSDVVTTTNFLSGWTDRITCSQFPAAFDETAPTLPNRSSMLAPRGHINNLSDAVTIESVPAWLAIGSFAPTARRRLADAYTYGDASRMHELHIQHRQRSDRSRRY